jgi:2-polyprenyl-3-methyl-5-hydroxy-6-metoxy-1,4-benzoquinol methylase
MPTIHREAGRMSDRTKDSVYQDYFANRGVTSAGDEGFRLPAYLRRILPADRGAKILDIGCGLGSMLLALRDLGYHSLQGVDVSAEAVETSRARGLDVVRIDDLDGYCRAGTERFELVLMSHVLEHLDKARTIGILRLIRERLLAPGAALVVVVPNAQSATGCYWAYEDFTHHTLFTAGSLQFVLRSAGFRSVEFLDPEAVADSSPPVRWIRRALLLLYRANLAFWNRVTGSAFHRASPRIFSFEIKILAR